MPVFDRIEFGYHLQLLNQHMEPKRRNGHAEMEKPQSRRDCRRYGNQQLRLREALVEADGPLCPDSV